MKLTLMKSATGVRAIALLMALPPAVLAANVMPSQGAPNTAPRPANEAVKPTKSESARTTVLVRNTAATPERKTATHTSEKPVAVAKEQKKKHDKNTISRCWKRLMDMAREANMAHRKKNSPRHL
jgi:hypothetical protein